MRAPTINSWPTTTKPLVNFNCSSNLMTYVLLCNYTSSLSNNKGLWPSAFHAWFSVGLIKLQNCQPKGSILHTVFGGWNEGMKSAWGHSRLGQGDSVPWTLSPMLCCGNSTNPRPTLIPTVVSEMAEPYVWLWSSSSSVGTTLWKVISHQNMQFTVRLSTDIGVGLCCLLIYNKTMHGLWWVKNSIKQTNTIQM